MNKLPMSKRVAIVSALVEGNSLRSTCRMTGVAMNTVLKLLAELGAACDQFHDKIVRDLKPKRVQCDEIWQFIGAKAKNVTTDEQKARGWGDCWTFTALDADTKLIISYLIGSRTPITTFALMQDLANRVDGRGMQLTTDGWTYYPFAVERAFGIDADYGQIVKRYGSAGESTSSNRYSPPKLTSVSKEVIRGNPDPRHISTSFVERQNLTMRMSMRRFTRLTNGFSKKAANHAHSVALHFMHYNFCRVHGSLRVTPAMEALLSDHVWSIEELIGLLDRRSAEAA